MRPLRLTAAALAAPLAVGACGKAPAPPTASGWSQLPSGARDLTDCAGAFAAAGGIDLAAARPQTQAPFYADYDRTVGEAVGIAGATEGATGGAKVYAAAEERRAYWNGQPAPLRAQRAADCKIQYSKAN